VDSVVGLLSARVIVALRVRAVLHALQGRRDYRHTYKCFAQVWEDYTERGDRNASWDRMFAYHVGMNKWASILAIRPFGW
jgi:hypothetical protein